MQFESFSDFIAMGGYGFYVWLSYGISTLLLILVIFNSLFNHKKIIRKLALRQQREQKLSQLRKQKNDTKIKIDNEVT